jgi:hypothetical protein
LILVSFSDRVSHFIRLVSDQNSPTSTSRVVGIVDIDHHTKPRLFDF